MAEPQFVPHNQEIDLEGGHLRLWPAFLDAGFADESLTRLWEDVAWSRHYVHIAGRRLRCPRLSAWYGAPGAFYRYSGQTHAPLPFSSRLDRLRASVEDMVGRSFNSVLLNAYRDGTDSMGWHSDDEPELGPTPVIASLSLGATRRFRLRHVDKRIRPHALDLTHGSLLVMDGETQCHWRHALARTRRPVGLRLNLTFRWIQTTDRP